MGHGTEKLHDPQRYKLKKNQYAAIALYPGETGWGSDTKPYHNIITDSNLQIIIPKGGKQFSNDLGFASRFGASLEDKHQLKIEHFKIYRPKMGDYDKQKYWYTLPDLIYYPTVYWKKNYESMYQTIYKGVKYNNLLQIKLSISGIIKSHTELYFKYSDINDFDKAFPEKMNNEENNYLPFIVYNNYTILIYNPQDTIDKKLIDIINDKEKDPLTYDFYCWLKASYRKSVIPLNDLLIMYYSRYVNPEAAIDEYKNIKKIFSTKKILEEWIHDSFTLNSILNIKIKLKDIYDLLEEIIKPQGPYIIFPLICRYSQKATSRTKKSAKMKSRPRHTRKLKRNFYTKSSST